jgi:tetratricopeptide (TPR) repeat protein
LEKNRVDNDFQAMYEKARSLYDEGNYDQAERLYLQVLKNSPKGYADVFNKLGLIQHRRGNLDKAADFFEKALSLNPKYTEASLNLAVTYNDLSRFDDADRIFSKAAAVVKAKTASLDPFIQGKLADAHGKLGDQYFDLALYSEALEEYRKALKLCPHFVDIIAKIGITLREQRAFDEAIQMLMKAKEINPKYILAYVHLGITYYMKGFLDLAMEEWEAAQRIDPSRREVQAYIALAKKETM